MKLAAMFSLAVVLVFVLFVPSPALKPANIATPDPDILTVHQDNKAWISNSLPAVGTTGTTPLKWLWIQSER